IQRAKTGTLERMEKHTSAAVWRTSALFLIAPPALLLMMALLKLDNEAGRVFGAMIFIASAAIWWNWLRVDAPLHNVPKSSAITALVAYVVTFAIAVVGYL